MVRKGLKKYASGLQKFYAEVMEVSSFQHRFADPVPTICLKNVRIDKATIATDHAWIQPLSMEQGEPFPDNLNAGDTIGFIAGVGKYEKGMFGEKKDYAFVRIKSIEVISKGEIKCK